MNKQILQKWHRTHLLQSLLLLVVFCAIAGYSVRHQLLAMADCCAVAAVLLVLVMLLHFTAMRNVIIVAVVVLLSLLPQAVVSDYGVLQGHFLRTTVLTQTAHPMAKIYIFTLCLLVLIAVSILFLMGRFAGVGLRIFVLLSGLLALCNAYCIAFRGAALRWADIAGVQALRSVLGQYRLFWDETVFAILALTMWGLVFLSHLLRAMPLVRYSLRARLGCGAVAGALWCVVLLCPIIDWFGLSVDYWSDGSAFLGNAFLQMRCASVQEPENYDEILQDLLERYVSESSESPEETEAIPENLPDVIVIMNESYTDLAAYAAWYGNTLALSEDIYAPLETLMEECFSGTLVTSVYGGTTANTEFEFLSGISTAFRTDVPYATSFSNLAEGEEKAGMLPAQFEAYGYTTIAMHPNIGGAWNRTQVYEAMGFDAFYDIDAAVYQDAALCGGLVTDASNYDAILAVLESAETEQPRFIFNVTIANHGSYTDSRGLPEVDVLGLAGEYPSAAHYLALVNQSTVDLIAFLEALQAREDPCIVLFFGDHKPSIEEELYQELSGEPYDLTQEALYHTPFFVWSNTAEYTQTGTVTTGRVSANYLALYLLELVEIPLTAQQEFLWDVYAEFPVLSKTALVDQWGNTLVFEEALEDSILLQQYEVVAYHQIEENGAGAVAFYQ